MSDLIKSVRINLAQAGGSELKAIASNEGLQELFAQKQALIAEMSQAKRAAADAAAQPYLEAIAEVDKMYGMLLTMIGDTGE